jgi:hypothetical protein
MLTEKLKPYLQPASGAGEINLPVYFKPEKLVRHGCHHVR